MKCKEANCRCNNNSSKQSTTLFDFLLLPAQLYSLLCMLLVAYQFIIDEVLMIGFGLRIVVDDWEIYFWNLQNNNWSQKGFFRLLFSLLANNSVFGFFSNFVFMLKNRKRKTELPSKIGGKYATANRKRVTCWALLLGRVACSEPADWNQLSLPASEADWQNTKDCFVSEINK